MDNRINILLSEHPISAEVCSAQVLLPEAGGVVVFVGTVRNQTEGKAVVRLEFEAYTPMAILEMEKIAKRALTLFSIQRVAIHHRTGVLTIGEIPVVIAVGAAHRGAAFDACEFCIDALKQTVPIWKKEIFEDGAVWVAAHP